MADSVRPIKGANVNSHKAYKKNSHLRIKLPRRKVFSPGLMTFASTEDTSVRCRYNALVEVNRT